MDRIDYTEQGVHSDCCGANVIFTDICEECREHCTPEEDNTEGEEYWALAQRLNGNITT